MAKRRNIFRLFRRHGAMRQRSAELVRRFEQERFPKAAAKPRPTGGARLKTGMRERLDAETQDITAALRSLGYQRAVAEKAARAARGSDFDSRMRSALAGASFGSIKAKNPGRTMKRRSRKKRNRKHRARRAARAAFAVVKNKNPKPVFLAKSRAAASRVARWLKGHFKGHRVRVVPTSSLRRKR